jgi:hypothetical protein
MIISHAKIPCDLKKSNYKHMKMKPSGFYIIGLEEKIRLVICEELIAVRVYPRTGTNRSGAQELGKVVIVVIVVTLKESNCE